MRYSSCTERSTNHKYHMGKLFAVAFLVLMSYQVVAQISSGKDHHLIKDLRKEWLAIDKNNRYVPFVARDKSNPLVIGVRLDLVKYSGNKLRCCVPAGSSILVDKQILTSVKQASCLTYDVDSLRQVYQQSAILLTVYQPGQLLSQIDLRVINTDVDPLAIGNGIAQRLVSAKGNFFVIGLFVILMLYAVLINQYSKTFKNIYSLQKILSFRAREEDMRVRLVSESHILFLVQHCLLIAFLLVMLIPNIGSQIPSMHFTLQSLSSYIFLWLSLSIAVLLVIWAKYILVITFGTLFKLRHLMYLHMFDFMRLSLMFWGVVFLLAICVYNNLTISEAMYTQVLTYLFVVFALVRILVLYLRLFRNASFKNMYLFSYICTAEIIPLLVGLELLIG